MSRGTDISAWQGNVDFNVMKSKLGEGGFAYIRAAVGYIDTDGSHHADEDARFAINWQASKAAGLNRGAYTYYHQDVSAGDQFMAFIKAINTDFGELPPAVDVEQDGAVWTLAQNKDLQWFLWALEKVSGKIPLIYTRTNYWDEHVANSLSGNPTVRSKDNSWAGHYGLWIAAWQPGAAPTGVPVLPAAWQPGAYKYWQWQVNDHGADYGVSSADIDLDVDAGVIVIPPNTTHPAPTFVADRTQIVSGASVILSWNAPGAFNIYLDNVGVSGPTGSKDVTPAVTTTYVFKAVYEDAPDELLPLTITVTPPVVQPGLWTAEYYANTKLSGTPVATALAVSAIAFDWKNGSPAAGVPADLFSARFTRKVSYPAGARQYTVRGDDGVRVWVDDALIIDAWVEQAASNHQAVVTLAAGVHTERIEYFEQAGLASLSFDSAPYIAPPPVVSIKPGRRGTGIHMLGGYSDALAATRCRDAVFMDPGNASRFADKLGKTACFDGLGVVMYRRYWNGNWPTFDQVMSQGMGNDPRILYIVTNEGEGLNKPDPAQSVYAHAELDIAVAREMAKRGCTVAVNTLATGNPNYTSAAVCQAIRVAYSGWWNTFAAENMRLYGKVIPPVWDQHDYSPNVQHIFDTWEGDITFAGTARATIAETGGYDVVDLFTPEVNEVLVGERNPHIAYVIARPHDRKVGLASPANIAGSKTVHIYESDWYETRSRFNVLLCGFDATKGIYVSSETLIDVGGKGGALGNGWGPADVLRWEARYFEIWGRPVTDEYGNTCCLNKEGAAIFQGQDSANGTGHWGSYYVGGMFDQLAPMWAR